MADESREEMLKRISENRGYSLEMHRIMAEVDMDWVTAYNQFIDATYTGQRLLDRKTKELLQVAVEAALKADVDQIQAHIRVAIAPQDETWLARPVSVGAQIVDAF